MWSTTLCCTNYTTLAGFRKASLGATGDGRPLRITAQTVKEQAMTSNKEKDKDGDPEHPPHPPHPPGPPNPPRPPRPREVG
jgi:hypothetical protein